MDEFIGISLATSFIYLLDDLIFVQVFKVQAIADVFTNRAREQNRLLLDDANLLMVPLWLELFNITTIKEDSTFIRVIKALN